MQDSALPGRLLDALARAYRVVGRTLQGDLEREEGITVDQWRVLRALGPDDGRTMGELTERLQIPAATITRLVDALVDRALVFRHARATDRRQVEVLLSSLGSQVLTRVEGLVQRDEARWATSTTLPLTDLIDALEALEPESAHIASASRE